MQKRSSIATQLRDYEIHLQPSQQPVKDNSDDRWHVGVRKHLDEAWLELPDDLQVPLTEATTKQEAVGFVRRHAANGGNPIPVDSLPEWRDEYA
jgi:hypothetical protein